MNKIDLHKQICIDLNELYTRKNHDYGDSFGKTFEEEGFAMARIRLSDKLERFKKLTRDGGQMVNDESIEDTLIDLANYAIMTVVEMRRGTESNEQPAFMDERLTGRFSNGQAYSYWCGENCKYDHAYCQYQHEILNETCPTMVEILEKLAYFERLAELGKA